MNLFGGICKANLLAVAVGLVIVSGCGGSGTTTVVPLASTISQFENGWTWTYNFSGTFTPTGSAIQSATGSRTITASVATAGQVTLIESTAVTTPTNTYSHTKQYVYTQSASGGLVLASITLDANPTETVSKTTFGIPGSITATGYATGTTTFQDSSTETDLFQVTGIQIVNCPVAKFSTWQIVKQTTYQNSPLLNVTEDLAPGICEPVSVTGTEYVSDGTYTGTFLLQSTNSLITTQPLTRANL